MKGGIGDKTSCRFLCSIQNECDMDTIKNCIAYITT